MALLYIQLHVHFTSLATVELLKFAGFLPLSPPHHTTATAPVRRRVSTGWMDGWRSNRGRNATPPTLSGRRAFCIFANLSSSDLICYGSPDTTHRYLHCIMRPRQNTTPHHNYTRHWGWQQRSTWNRYQFFLPPPTNILICAIAWLETTIVTFSLGPRRPRTTAMALSTERKLLN